MNARHVDTVGGFPIMEEIDEFEAESGQPSHLHTIFRAAIYLRGHGNMSDHNAIRTAINIYDGVVNALQGIPEND